MLGLVAALADGTGTVSEEERKDILMVMSPVDVHEALLALLSEVDRLEVGHRRTWLRADLSAPAIEKAACGTGGAPGSRLAPAAKAALGFATRSDDGFYFTMYTNRLPYKIANLVRPADEADLTAHPSLTSNSSATKV